jgi:hypothetical protein
MAIDPQMIGATLASGLSARTLATWHGGIARTPRVMVPIQLDALVVRAQGGTWAQTAMNAPASGTQTTAPGLLAEPFAERDSRPPGVYLHWALPDALTRATVSTSDPTVQFPAVPDRWLVARLYDDPKQSRRAVRAWVIEAGDETPVVRELSAWSETADPDRTDTAGKRPLSALGYGDAGWSAYFDNVENRLGYYDDLAGVTGPVAYLVCGWHSRHLDDPIGEGLSSPTQFEQRLDELGWEINAADIESAFVYSQRLIETATALGLQTREARYSERVDVVRGKVYEPSGVADERPTSYKAAAVAADGIFAARAVSWPQFCVYHGAVVGIGWPGPGLPVAPEGLMGGDAGGPPAASDVSVYLGNALTETLAACLAANTGHPDEARVLEAVLLGASGELQMPDAPARIDMRLHANGFSSLPGDVSTDTLLRHTDAPPTSITPDPSATKPGVFASLSEPAGSKRRLASTVSAAESIAEKFAATATPHAPSTGAGTTDTVLTKLSRLRLEDVAVRVPRSANTDTVDTVEVQRALPRYFVPADPVFLLEGAGRSFKHGSDGRFSESGKLACRLSGHTVDAYLPNAVTEIRSGLTGADLLAGGVDHGAVPPECQDLLEELPLLDPGSAPAAAAALRPATASIGVHVRDQLAADIAVEQCAWWAGHDERRDIAGLVAASGLRGTLPAAVAITPPVRPWTPLHLDWSVELFAATDLDGWQLDEVDFGPATATVPGPAALPTLTLSGRALLSGGAAQVAAATVRTVLQQAQQSGGSQQLVPGRVHAWASSAARALVGTITTMRAGTEILSAATADGAATAAAGSSPGDSDADLDHIADELARMDVLVGAMDRFTTRLRAGYPADRTSAPAPGDPVPADFWPVRSGFLRVRRLRVIDCFGQTLDLLGSSDQQEAQADQLGLSEPLTVQARPDLVELAPRFTAPSRLWFRFQSAADDATEAALSTSPVCGFVLPNHIDGDLQFYGADGSGLGAVRFDEHDGVVWEDAPGASTNVGTTPTTIVSDPHLAGVAQGLLDWGLVDATPDAPSVDTALSSVLRLIDTSLWTVDPFGHIGDEHLSLLVGHPIAVMRAILRLEVAEPVTPDLVKGMRFPVRIGALAHWQDGLLAYFVDDDYRTLHISDPAGADFARPVGPNQGFNQQANATSDYYTNFAADLGAVTQPGATPVDHPYVDTSGVLWVQPEQDVRLTLLMEPHSVVHATTGYLPRKEIGMRREWVAPGLSKLAPVFRFGPVLVDPKLIRMPVAADIHGTWSWSHRSDASTWADDPVVNSVGDQRIPLDPSDGQEGWLRLSPDQPPQQQQQ